MADLEKKILEAPKLPNHIQGDGRYLMSLLKSFLEQTAEQVNLANGFSAEEINPEAGGYPMPKDFFLSFTRLGGELTWSHLYDVSELAYYELRTNPDVGANNGLLERTLNNNSTVLPLNYADTIYLYAVSKEGKVSSPSVINYSKPRPDVPQDITVTKTSEGALITFLEIPSNCIGANIYIDSKKYVAQDNIFLVTGTQEMEKVEVAYYDQFGEGERGVLYIILPDVTGFLVERNGPELDFYWDDINIYGIKYVVKVGASTDWSQAVELFRTETNRQNRWLYPNTGEYYLLVKAYDENGNYSKNAAYQIMNTELDISRNVILEFNQNDVFYNGSKLGVFYDPSADGVVLDRDAIKGEYMFSVQLPQRYRARNWIEYNTLSYSNDLLAWDDAVFSWEDASQRWVGVVGNIDGCIVKTKIAFKKDDETQNVFDADLNGTLISTQGINPFESQHADDFRQGRWGQGLYVDMLTKLAYEVDFESETFSVFFNLKTFKVVEDTVLMVMSDDDNQFLMLGYDTRTQSFYLNGSDGIDIKIPCVTKNMTEYYSIGISQGADKRCLYINTYNENKLYQGQIDAIPICKFNKIYCYPKLEPTT